MKESTKRNRAESKEVLSEYEILRQQKILRNEEKLRSLGLLTTKKESVARKSYKRTDLDHPPVETSTKPTAVTESNAVVPSRRMSLRLQGIDPFPRGKKNFMKLPMKKLMQWSDNALVDVTNVNSDNDRVVHQQPAQSVRQTVSQPQQQLLLQPKSSHNKSTTKEHCQMRIRTMTIPQLQQRIRIIERAQGQHCIAKLAIMQECCIEANLYELAQQAQEAIQRLTNHI